MTIEIAAGGASGQPRLMSTAFSAQYQNWPVDATFHDELLEWHDASGWRSHIANLLSGKSMTGSQKHPLGYYCEEELIACALSRESTDVLEVPKGPMY